jgi:hypothetical protein
MNRRRLVLLLSTASLVSFCACAGSQPGSYPDTNPSSDVGFYDELSPYGTWENVAPYGDCWVPLDVPVGWRPYTEGYWENTDYGWMWISQDPWGQTPYHYGRWAEDDSYGWVWVPDDDEVWAPAWVAWRYGGGYVGWAPLPPDVGWQSGTGLSVSAADLDQRIARDSWCFAPTRAFGTTRMSASVLPPSRNLTLISLTLNVTHYDVFNSRPAERGLSLDILERDTGRKFQRYQVTDSSSPASRRGSGIRGQTIEVYRPPVTGVRNRPVRPTPETQPAPSPAVIQRLDADQRQFDQRMQKERAALGREHQNELKQQGKPGAPGDLLRQQQQQAELKAQQDREAKERRALDQRRKIVQDRQRNQGQGRGQGQGKGNAQGQGRGQGQGKGQGQGQGQGANPDSAQGSRSRPGR